MKTINSIAGVIGLVISTTAASQGITQKPVTGADRKKTTAPASSTKPAETTDDSTVTQQATTEEPTDPQSSAPGQTGNTPGQAQSGPGQASELTPAQTGTTPSGQTTGNAPATATEPPAATATTTAPALTAATAADVKKDVEVYDKDGALVGKIESVTGKDAVVSTGTTRASIAISSFAKNDKGLVLGMTKAELEAAAKPAPKKKS